MEKDKTKVWDEHTDNFRLRAACQKQTSERSSRRSHLHIYVPLISVKEWKCWCSVFSVLLVPVLGHAHSGFISLLPCPCSFGSLAVVSLSLLFSVHQTAVKLTVLILPLLLLQLSLNCLGLWHKIYFRAKWVIRKHAHFPIHSMCCSSRAIYSPVTLYIIFLTTLILSLPRPFL